MSDKKYVLGLDYGSDSARAVLVDAATGDEIATSVKHYPRWIEGKYCDPARDQYRQHPLDYIEVMEYIVKDTLKKAGPGFAEKVVGISFDTTGSTPVFVNEEGTPLALLPEFAENPNAMFVLWKDHTAVKEAAEINELARKWKIDYTKYEGGIYSSEWVWAKVLHVLRSDEKVRKAAYSWIEHCDWMPALITGRVKPGEVIRSRCSAGHKAMWHESWGGLPEEEFLTALDPLLAGYRDRLYKDTYTADVRVGNLTPEWAERLGLTTRVAVGVGAFDCHMGAVGGGVTPNVLARAIGTSTCDIMIAPYDQIGDKLIAGICGQVDGSVIPGYVGLEAGQSGFGDIYAWFKRVISWPLENILADTTIVDAETRAKLIEETEDKIIPKLSEAAMKIPVEESTVIAVDWMNGRRTPDASQEVTGSIAGLKLGSDAPRIFRALVEATAFGSKAIVDRFAREGVRIDGVIGLGGVAKKSPFVMQTLADVLNMPIKVARTVETCAVGAAMFATVAAGVHSNVEEAQKAMAKGFEKEYTPNPANVKAYAEIYEKYVKLGAFTEREKI
ncbi:ribulokinase [Xiashengella succiniciproducens]|jgi:L-ribulokinase|uniref:Ribulokinase n=1 Tax=Xiashengella succiniciproducens TaxID=2949635 RepID=A0A9J6ZS42_9BACT|nr:ribulokinase [Alkaliflexus sp. Ai-910]URW80040.1 ribulokinase [Alkaliflexus sp. Ai-910]HHU01494.1 ribulokinase [Bacteroidales bacterium]